MPFQSTVNLQQGFGVAGDFAFSSPHRCIPAILDSTDGANNVVGRAFTITTGATGTFDTAGGPRPIVAQAGGTGAFAGILAHSNEYASRGGMEGTLAPTMQLANNSVVTLCVMGEITAYAPTAANPGDLVYYNNKTGELAFAAPAAAAPAGSTLIKTAVVHMYASAGASLAVIRLTEPSLVIPAA